MLHDVELSWETCRNGLDFSIRVKHEPTGKVVEMERRLQEDSRHWIDVSLDLRKTAIEKLEEQVRNCI